ncbi:claudin domain-containing protein 2 isoform X1 [Monodon monoceros]|uniref:claudin domain-containing protein 2 isoform X1 n=1 Tax=Monodon monoceros TaxID=40151 RepID=UPI0010F9DE59|nr:claudin domain-containing protein 2 isoform X1 [Monodon monoceros]
MEGHARGGLRDLGVGGALANPACMVLGSSLPGMGVKRSLQSGGTLLGFLANILTILSMATNYWIRYSGGHSGLWQECSGGTCSNMSCQTMLAVTGACMVLAAGCSIVGLVMGLRILCQEGDSRGRTTSAIFFLCGFCFLLADMIMQSTDAISGFPVCL